MTGRPRITLVHERFTEYAGSEAVVEQLALEWPEAPIFTPIARLGIVPAELERRLRATWLSRFLHGSAYAHLLPALPIAMRHLRLPPSDVVIASHHAFATQVVRSTSAPVIAYVHSPARWVWDPSMRAGEAGGEAANLALAAFSAAFRPLDVRAAAQVQTLVANSHAVAERIREWWQRDAVVVHPPVDTEFYTPDAGVPREDFFLLAGRVVPYKRPELAVRAARLAKVPLVVAGEGRSGSQLERLAGPGTTILGRVDRPQLRDLFRRCRALLMPGIEDFGIVPVEAQACGAPVLAVGLGGARDSVLPGRTGELIPTAGLPDHELELWAQALTSFTGADYDASAIRAHAESFSRKHFRAAMAALVSQTLGRT